MAAEEARMPEEPPRPVKRLRIALVGAGRRSRAHLPVIAKLTDHFELVAVCDVREENARSAAERYGVPWYTDLRRMLDEVRPDICDVVVPGEAHHIVAPAIAAAGVHILVETPLAITLPAIDLMIAAAREHGVHLEVAENVWRYPYERLKQRILVSGLAGEPLRGYCVYPTGGYHAVNGARTYVGGTARRVWGSVRRWPVPLVTDHAGRQITEESWTLGVIEFDNGRMAVVEYSNTYSTILRRDGPRYIGFAASRGHAFSPSYAGPGTLYVIEGNEARAYPMQEEVRQYNGVRVPLRFYVETDPPVVYENPFAAYGVTAGEIAVADELASIHRAVAEGREPEYGAAAGRHDQEIVIALHESSRLGRPVELPLRTLTGYEAELHERFRAEHGYDILDTEALLQHAFPVR
jgi:predicted dehydrogenase